MGKFNDLTGKKFGDLTVIRRLPDYISPKGRHQTVYLCRCKCGNEFPTRYVHLMYSHKGQCPVCGHKIGASKITTHGHSHKEPLYNVWKGIRERCNNPNGSYHHIYHDRGIEICAEWNDYSVFREWALNNGWVKGLTIDRINGNLGYSPANCRIVTIKENNLTRVIGRNKSNGQYISIRNHEGK